MKKYKFVIFEQYSISVDKLVSVQVMLGILPC